MVKDIIKEMRIRQWIKNVFVLAAVVFDRQLKNPEALWRSILGFIIFCLISSSIYFINDLFDKEADRNHPVKKNRPIASGRLPVPIALAIAIILTVVSLAGAFLLSLNFGWIIFVYFVLNLAYSKWLKHIAIIDVLVIAAGFVLRVAGGVTLIVVERFSPWLYVVTTLFALYIGFGKRRTELALLSAEANNHRRVLEGYTLPFLDQLIIIVSSTTLVAYSLYTFSAPNLPDNHSMMLTIPYVLYGIFRYLYLVQVKQAGGAPEDVIMSDRPLQATVFLWGLSILVIFYLF
jgi:4-hydroxybenzoate polyprenyltransferase